MQSNRLMRPFGLPEKGGFWFFTNIQVNHSKWPVLIDHIPLFILWPYCLEGQGGRVWLVSSSFNRECIHKCMGGWPPLWLLPEGQGVPVEGFEGKVRVMVGVRGGGLPLSSLARCGGRGGGSGQKG